MPSFVRDHPLASQLQTAAPQRVGSSTASSQFDISRIDPTVKLPKNPSHAQNALSSLRILAG